ncbi:hypothetical protein AX760_13150 [Pararhizobium antarcticum]|uniref:Uncharacterized protein n=1 Tax=Pararhizobium antarcticum TaxID=1798805 RepID=A0A657LZX2_9HYPH|nr:hypothetical protein AX761_17200 [Rhizobium sp. 58]OJF99425.1 hypothetical protein AX760_13150 [Pararhizobium antarcticum]
MTALEEPQHKGIGQFDDQDTHRVGSAPHPPCRRGWTIFEVLDRMLDLQPQGIRHAIGIAQDLRDCSDGDASMWNSICKTGISRRQRCSSGRKNMDAHNTSEPQQSIGLRRFAKADMIAPVCDC